MRAAAPRAHGCTRCLVCAWWLLVGADVLCRCVSRQCVLVKGPGFRIFCAFWVLHSSVLDVRERLLVLSAASQSLAVP